MLTTDQKGAIAEAEIAIAAVKLGIGVFKPLVEGERYDFVFDLRPRLVRVQCKWASLCDDVIVVRCYSARRNRAGLLRRCYELDELDVFAAYCPDTDRCYYLPIERFHPRREIRLRVAPTRNNQSFGVTWADDYEFAATLGKYPGAIAQLGERERGTLEVAGSSPAGSTLFPLDEHPSRH
jgi:PD-(D/E)XK endonuclease